MPTESDGQGESPPDPAHSGSDQIRPRNRNRRGKQKNNTKFGAASQSKPPSTVEPELKGYYYELPNVDPRVPPFLQVVKAHIAYFVSNRKDASDYLMVGESTSTAKDPFSLPPLVAPNLPDWDNKQEEHDYLKKDKKYEAEKSVCKANEAALCAMLKRHCSAAFLSAAESHPKWSTVIANNSSMDMLKVFQIVAATGGSTNVDPTMMGVEAQRKAYTCKQKENQTNAEYLQVFMQLSNTARFCDCPMGASLSRLIQETGKSDPTLAELRAVEEKIVEKEMARMAFLLGADRKRYGGLIAQANHARLFSGSDTFPTTMSGAIELLNNSRPLVTLYHSSIRSSEIGASFLADGQPSTESGAGGRGGGPNGRSGGGRNGGRGSSGRGGRGRDFERRPNRNHEQHETHITDTSNNNNNDEVDEYLTTEEPSDSTNPVNTDSIAVDEDVSTTEHLFLHSNNKLYVKLILKRHPQSGLPVTWIVLDTGSTANIFCNRSLLQNIHKVKHGLKVRCNAGVVQLNMKGYFGDYPDPVWFNPDGIANILSFHDVNKHYHVVYDNRGADQFVVDFGGTKKVEFLPTDKGLYHIDLDDYCKTSWTFLETVKEQKAKHTKAAVMRAAQAQHI
ncbi:unnamed protein product [Cylindrotheca closterium]|uniref:Uncharacterized protein n=1 Tax=Cylindrotheca closterium TaxID=2856 RepID=A0AAD2G5M0_9STRA|nr:unnamed protein product [Cylindrotheca closterium]